MDGTTVVPVVEGVVRAVDVVAVVVAEVLVVAVEVETDEACGDATIVFVLRSKCRIPPFWFPTVNMFSMGLKAMAVIPEVRCHE